MLLTIIASTGAGVLLYFVAREAILSRYRSASYLALLALCMLVLTVSSFSTIPFISSIIVILCSAIIHLLTERKRGA